MKMLLLTKAIRRKLPPLYANEEQGTDALAIVKFFTPDRVVYPYVAANSTNPKIRYNGPL